MVKFARGALLGSESTPNPQGVFGVPIGDFIYGTKIWNSFADESGFLTFQILRLNPTLANELSERLTIIGLRHGHIGHGLVKILETEGCDKMGEGDAGVFCSSSTKNSAIRITFQAMDQTLPKSVLQRVFELSCTQSPANKAIVPNLQRNVRKPETETHTSAAR